MQKLIERLLLISICTMSFPKYLVFSLLLASAAAWTISVQDDCKPFAPRLNLGLHFYDRSSPEMIGIRFNTKAECRDSFAMFRKNTTYLSKIPCTTDTFTLQTYTTYIHKCSINKLEYGQNYTYMVFGWSKVDGYDAVPYHQEFIPTHLMDNHSQLKIVAIADWGFLRDKAGIYDPLDQVFQNMLDLDQRIDGIYIGGDIAYDLDSYQGLYYEDFILMLSQVGSRWPVILNNGNHEHLTLEDEVISKKTFELYNSQENRVTVLYLPFVNFLMLDPYLVVFKNEDPTSLNEKLDAILLQLSLRHPNTPIVASSHYPYRCNGNIKDCFDIRQKMAPFFATMMKYNVALYMGAHYHTYERVYPYFNNETFVKKESPYIWRPGGNEDYKDNTLLSIVEGIAGNDREIIMDYPPPEQFTAAYSIGNTGFGVMTYTEDKLHYVHVINKNRWEFLDEWEIIFDRDFQEEEK